MMTEMADKVASHFKAQLGKEITVRSKAIAHMAAEMMIGDSNDTASAYSSTAKARKMQKLTRAFEVVTTDEKSVTARTGQDDRRDQDEISRIFMRQSGDAADVRGSASSSAPRPALDRPDARASASSSAPRPAIDRPSNAPKAMEIKSARRAEQEWLRGTPKQGATAIRPASPRAPARPASPRGRPDTARARPDTAHARPDTAHARPDTAHARQDTAHARPASSRGPPPRPNTARASSSGS